MMMVHIRGCTITWITTCCFTWPTKTSTTAFVTPSLPRFGIIRSAFSKCDEQEPIKNNIHNNLDDDECARSNHAAAIIDSHHRRRLIQLSSSSVISGGITMCLSSFPQSALAGIDPSALRSLPIEGDASGSTTRLRQISSLTNSDATSPRPDDSKDIAFTILPSGEGSYRTYREGSGDITIQPGSKVAVEMTIRCRSFATTDEPGGVAYFTTKGDTEFNELAWTIGEDGAIVPSQLEECMMGMKKRSVRRIELPSPVVYAAYKAGRLPLPSEKNKDGRRRFEKLWKTDATLLFEVLVTRIK